MNIYEFLRASPIGNANAHPGEGETEKLEKYLEGVLVRMG